jgi:hypothetical protein
MSQKLSASDTNANPCLVACIDDLLGPESDALSYLDKTVMEDTEKNGFRLYDRMRNALSSLKDVPAVLDSFLCQFIAAPLFSKFVHKDSSNLLHVLETAYRMTRDVTTAEGMTYPLALSRHADLIVLAKAEPTRFLRLLPVFLSSAPQTEIPPACEEILTGDTVFAAGMSAPINAQTTLLQFFAAVPDVRRTALARHILTHDYMKRLSTVHAGQYLSLVAGLMAHLPESERFPFLTDAFQSPAMAFAFSHAKIENENVWDRLSHLFGFIAEPDKEEKTDIQDIQSFLKVTISTAFDHWEKTGETAAAHQSLNDILNGPCLAAAERRDPKALSRLTAAASAHTLRELTRLKHNHPTDLIETILQRLSDKSQAPTRTAGYLGHLFSSLRAEEWPAVLECKTFSDLIQKRPEILPAFFFPAIRSMDVDMAGNFKAALMGSRSFATYQGIHAEQARAIVEYNVAAALAQKNPAGRSPAGP